MPSKFRSIQAFKDYEEKSFSYSISDDDASPEQAPEVSKLRVMSLVKKNAQGVRRRDIARELGADLEAVDDAVLRLLKDDFVKIRPGETPEDDLIVP